MKLIGEVIRKIRLSHTIKLGALAEKIGISQSYLSEIETGKKDISIEILMKCSNIFGIRASNLMEYAELLEDGFKKQTELELFFNLKFKLEIADKKD